jgi:putative tryptophan/tyrosine transport system substrate-binding protein
MRRREFIAGLGSAAAWPVAARAQQPNRMRRIGVLMNLTAEDAEGQVRLAAFQGLEASGWSVGRNVRIDTRWGSGDADRLRIYAAELVALNPEVIFAAAGGTMSALVQATRTIPIVFAQVLDPVGSGYVASLARPGGNTTGFTQFEFSIGGKWLKLLREIGPQVMRAAVLRVAAEAAGIGQWGAIQSMAPSLGMEVTPLDVSDPAIIERSIAAFARGSNGGLIVTGSAPAAVHRETIIANAARHRLPAIYPYRYFPVGGGLISYGPDTIDPYRRAAGYVDRILKGEKPAELPVQTPTRYELVINLKTANALGLTIPETLLATADEVIQ